MAKKRQQKIKATGDKSEIPFAPDFVAKHMNTFNRAVTMVDRKKKDKGSNRKAKHKNDWSSKDSGHSYLNTAKQY